MGELGRLECWVAKQANLTSNAFAGLLSDEEITRHATLQNRTATDYLLLLHQHSCEEFEGFCCFNLSSKAEDVRKSISQIRERVDDIKKESKDWFDNIFGNLGLWNWTGSIIKTGLLIFYIILITAIALRLIKKLLSKLVVTATSPKLNWAEMAENTKMQDLSAQEENVDFLPEVQGQWPIPFNEWPTNQQWFGELYPNSEYLAPQPQFRSF